MPVKEVSWGGRVLRVHSLDQANLGMEVRVSPGDQVNTYCNTATLKILAGLFDACSEHGEVALLMRHAPSGADLAIFRGTDVPLNFPGYRRLVGLVRKTPNSDYVTPEVRPQRPSDHAADVWRQADQLTVRAQAHCVLLSGTRYGLRMCALSCVALTEGATTDHYHFDDWWLGSSKTVEFILRNSDAE